MFPTFDVPPQHAETVGARKARKAREEDTKRSSSTTSHSSSSTRSATASGRRLTNGASESRPESRGFGWFGKSNKKGVQEISTLPTNKKASPSNGLDQEIDAGPAPRTAPLPTQYEQETVIQSTPLHHFEQESYPSFRAPPPLNSLPSLPPQGALPLPPSPSLLSTAGMF